MVEGNQELFLLINWGAKYRVMKSAAGSFYLVKQKYIISSILPTFLWDAVFWKTTSQRQVRTLQLECLSFKGLQVESCIQEPSEWYQMHVLVACGRCSSRLSANIPSWQKELGRQMRWEETLLTITSMRTCCLMHSRQLGRYGYLVINLSKIKINLSCTKLYLLVSFPLFPPLPSLLSCVFSPSLSRQPGTLSHN